ncbi:putative Transposon TX1 [Gossypium australe]|uniref:Putative Transposon TX1 n=1 Tax=Gossypium australe TaxID=47621 RepID=A0A5B6VBN4_9ROSI|nr:putative Transposon TX1 [Gossypium australe]
MVIEDACNNEEQVEANEFASGIWFGWNENFLVDILEVHPQVIHVKVCNKQRSYSFFCSFVYASPQSATKKKLWYFLGSLVDCLEGPWVLIGDFNSILDSSKRAGGASILKAGCKWFHEFLFNNALWDLGASGAQFTWCRDCSVRNLHRLKWDHRPILISLRTMTKKGTMPFRCLASWMLHENFNNLVNRNWNNEMKVSDNLDHFQKVVERWNKNVYGNIFARKKKLVYKLERVQRILDMCFSSRLHSREIEIRQDLEEVLRHEEILWFQKSRPEGLQNGDRNTSYFHNRTLARRKQNRIDGLILDNNDWCFDEEILKQHVVDFLISFITRITLLVVCFIVVVKFFSNSVRCYSLLGVFLSQTEFGGGQFLDPKLNKTLLVLLSKIQSPERISQFRPISLCMMIYKIITKILVNKLRPLMVTLTRQNQTSFIPARNITDNIVVAQDVVHSMILKIDLEKAYDRVKWDFLEDTLLEIMWNGAITDSFQPIQGIRQGDPHSPYLFVLCMERLGHMFDEAIERGSWKPLTLSWRGPILSQSMLFCEASKEQAGVVNNILDTFCYYSGQKMNKGKSQAFFSPNTLVDKAYEIFVKMGFNRVEDLGFYLGMLLFHSRVTVITFDFVVSTVRQKLSRWEARKLPLASHITLVRFVLLVIPNYFNEIEKMAHIFIWGVTAEKKKLALLSWKDCCCPLDNGDLGLRNLADQNNFF